MFKTEFKMEPYLHLIKSRKKRVNLTRIRISAHRLEIENGRYSRPVVNTSERYCKVCNKNLVEDEKHFIIECEKYNVIRLPFLMKINVDFPFTRNLNEFELFKWIMTFQNKKISHELATFINKCFEIRNHTLEKTNIKKYMKRKANKLNPPMCRIKRLKVK